MQARPLSDCTLGHSSSFPTHAWIWSKARTQTSSPCTTSTATASVLMVVLFLLARLPGCPHPAACRVTLTETYTTHRQSNVAPGLVHPRRVSATTPRDAVGSRLTRCGERSSCQSSSAGPGGAPRVLFSALQGKSRQLPLLLPATSPELTSARCAPGWGPAPPPGARSP